MKPDFSGDPRRLSPGSLAFIGDAVFELLVRERLLGKGSMPAGKLHMLAVGKVSAAAQARAYRALEAALDGQEHDILRRGRNAHTTRAPKSCTPEDYRKATAIEALFGYLYLKQDIARMEELFALVDAEIIKEE